MPRRTWCMRMGHPHGLRGQRAGHMLEETRLQLGVFGIQGTRAGIVESTIFLFLLLDHIAWQRGF